MALSYSLFETISAVVPDQKSFFSIAASVAIVAAVIPKGTKKPLAGKPAVINDLIKLRSPPFWLAIFLVIPF